MNEISALHSFWILALNTLLHEVGIPVPVMPTALVLAAHAVRGAGDFVLLVAAIAIGMLIGNSIWFAAGRRYGPRVLWFLCRFSLTADTCVSRTEKTFGRWGAWSLVIGRFLPGVSLVAPPLAGAVGMSWGKFVALTVSGAAVYGVVVLGAGLVFHNQIATVLRTLQAFGWQSLAVAIVVLAMYIVWRWWRRRVARAPDLTRISVDELKTLMSGSEQPLIVDVRGPTTHKIDPRRIPDAIPMALEVIEDNRHDLPRDRMIVLYCGCPNEASAAKAARLLLARGYPRVRPLAGGLDAWNATLDHEPVPGSRDAGIQLSNPVRL